MTGCTEVLMNIIESKKYISEVRQIAKLIPSEDLTVLVTGATGLIGSCIVDVFLHASNSNIKVIVLGRNKDKLKARFNYAKHKDINYVAQNVIQPLEIPESIDYIIHAASNADPVSYSLYPVETILTNIYGTNNMLNYCKEHKSTRLLLTSTFEVYGQIKNQNVYIEEDSGEIDLNAVRSCYPESKRCAEILMRCYQKEYDINCTIARLSSIYGPTMNRNDSKAHAQFIRRGLAGKDIILKSKGDQKRTYCYLMDAISGILTVLFKGKCGEAYNISNENSIVTIADVANAVASICGTKVVFDNPDSIEQQGFSRSQNCILDNKKLRELGWHGKYSLNNGLLSTIHILRELSYLEGLKK